MIKGIIGEPEEDACFADSRVANQQQLEEIIVSDERIKDEWILLLEVKFTHVFLAIEVA